jgi:hypothetical protein
VKLAILGVIAFVAALAGGTGFGIATAPKPKPAPAVSAPAAKPAPAPAPTPPAPTAVAASATPLGPPVQTVPPLSDSSHVAAALKAANAAAATLAATAPKAPTKPATPEDYSAIAKILSDMKPKQANEILSHLSDDEVEGILRTVAARSAAVLLAQMPATRAAEMSRRLMQPKGAR